MSSRRRNKFARWKSRRKDEMPRNTPSGLVTSHCSADVSWLEDSTSFGGHSDRKAVIGGSAVWLEQVVEMRPEN